MAFRRSSGRARRLRRYLLTNAGSVGGALAIRPTFFEPPAILGLGQVGQLLTGFDGVILNGAPLSRRWLLDGVAVAQGPTYLAAAAGSLIYEVTAQGLNSSTISASPALMVASRAAFFSRQPAIGTDGSPSVGEIVSLDFGAVAGDAIGTRQILRADNSVVATIDTGSYQLADAGQIKLRVYAAATVGLFAESPLITVAAVATGALVAPILSNAPSFVSGTNPPRQQITIAESIDKTAYKLVGQWDYSLSGAFTYAAARSFEIADLMAFAEAEDAAIAGYADQPAGAWRLRTRYVSLTDPADVSPWSNYWTDTLNAPALPAATTMFDRANKKTEALVTETVAGNGDYRFAAGNAGGLTQTVLVDTARADARFFAMELVARGEDNGPSSVWIGICPGDTVLDPSANALPPGAVWVRFDYVESILPDDEVTITVKPATKDAQGNPKNDGTFEARLNGTVVVTKAPYTEVSATSHALVSYKAFFACLRTAKVRFNAGQEPFGFTPSAPAGVVRYN